MAWLVIALGYFLGSFPTAYVAGRMLRGVDIRQLGDGNVGAANAYRELGPRTGFAVFFIDVAKGMLAVFLAQAANSPQPVVLIAGVAVVAGHNWPVFLGFRAGRGEATAIGVLYALVPWPMLIVSVPALAALIIWKNVILASAVLFVPISAVCWAMGVPGVLVAYSIGLPCLVAFTHFLRTRPVHAGRL